jgi:hypothetical protein
VSAEALRRALLAEAIDCTVESRSGVALVVPRAGAPPIVGAARVRLVELAGLHGFKGAAVELPGDDADATLLRR